MSRSKSLVLVFSSVCALAACACTRIPARSTTRQAAEPVVVQEPMGNPSWTEPAPKPEPVLANQLMEPDFDVPAETTVKPAPGLILELDDPAAEVQAPTPVPDPETKAPAPDTEEDTDWKLRRPRSIEAPAPDQSNPDEIVGPGSR